MVGSVEPSVAIVFTLVNDGFELRGDTNICRQIPKLNHVVIGDIK
jgi:hypothetical protein